jgi:hypothetical protein
MPHGFPRHVGSPHRVMPFINDRAVLCTALGVVCALFCYIPADDTVRVEWKFNKSDSIRYRIVQDSLQDTKGNNADGSLAVHTAFLLTFSALDVSEAGTAMLEATYDAARASIRLPGFAEIAFDSTKPAGQQRMGDPYVRMMSVVIGKKFYVQVTRRGVVESVSGSKAIVEQMLKTAEGLPIQKTMREPLEQTFGDDAMKRTLSTFFHVVPEKQVKPGDTWSTQEPLPMPGLGKANFENQFTLKRFENVDGDGCIRAELNIRPTVSVDREGAISRQFDVTYLGGEGSGDLLFSFAKGRSLKSTSKYTMKLSAAPKLAESAPKDAGPILNTFQMETRIEWVDRDGNL